MIDTEWPVDARCLHFWRDGLYYAAQEADGAGGAPSRISDTPSDAPQIVIDAQGVSHIVWVTNGDVYYVTLP